MSVVEYAVLFAVALFLCSISIYSHVAPLPLDADPNLFSEARARAHVDKLATEIGDRQVGTP